MKVWCAGASGEQCAVKGLEALLATSSQKGVGRSLSPPWTQEAAVPGGVALGTDLGCNLQE